MVPAPLLASGDWPAIAAAFGRAVATATADLVHLGPIWPTPSKPPATPLPEAALAPPRGRSLLVADGGIDTPSRARLATTAGASAVAVIRAAWSGVSLAPFVASVEAALS